jgi:hypothetical protein
MYVVLAPICVLTSLTILINIAQVTGVDFPLFCHSYLAGNEVSQRWPFPCEMGVIRWGKVEISPVTFRVARRSFTKVNYCHQVIRLASGLSIGR